MSAAGSIKAAFNIPHSSTVRCGDCLSVGEQPLTADFAKWRDQRISALESAYGVEQGDLFNKRLLLDNFAALQLNHPVLIWQDDHVQSQLLTALLCYLFRENNWDNTRLHTVRFGSKGLRIWESNIAVISENKLRERRPDTEKLPPESFQLYADIWSQFAGSDLQVLLAMLINKDVAALTQNSLGYLLRRLPSRKSGLSEGDAKLLGYIINQAPSAIRAVADSLGYNETRDSVGDLNIFNRLTKFASPALAHPLIKIENPEGTLRDCTTEILPLAHEVLAGRANMIELNGLDDWLGGVHLTPANFVYREDVAPAN